MKKLILKDKKKRVLYYKYEIIKYILINIIKNKNIFLSKRLKAFNKLNYISKQSSKIQLSNRCNITGRKYSINKKYRFSRITMLKFSRYGLINGIKKV